MFLSKAAITKQLFYEFLNFETLALAPGRPIQLLPGTLFGSSTNLDIGPGIEFAERQLKANLGKQAGMQEKQEQFNYLLSSLASYKKASQGPENPFLKYAKADDRVGASVSAAHPCAWLLFAPLVIEPDGSTLTYETEDAFKEYLKHPKVACSFDINCTVDKTGLYIAVLTKNHEMVNAFLCHDFYHYRMTLEDLKILLSLTHDPKTRMALYRHSEELINWISTDEELQGHCVKSFEELSEFWSYLPVDQRLILIGKTKSELWLNLLDKELGKQKIQKLLGSDFALLNAKLLEDFSIKNRTLIPKTLRYLRKEQQFDYLLKKTNIDTLFPLPRGDEWARLLSSLGYHQTKDRQVTTLRYVLPKELAKVHNNLISVLITLPVEAHVIIDALERIEAYVHHPDREREYEGLLTQIGNSVAEKEFDTGYTILNWFYNLLRYLNIKSASPLHPHLKRLAQVIKGEPTIIPGELMDILPPQEDYKIYREALFAYSENQIDSFWLSLPAKEREKIISEPIRFAELIRFLSAPVDRRTELFDALEEEELVYFNTPKGVRQLVLETPSFDVAKDLPHLIDVMKSFQIEFLEDESVIVQLLLDNNEEVFKQIAPFFPGNNSHDLNFQQSILERLPKPLQKEHFSRFLQAYCVDANHFSLLLLQINESNNFLVEEFWGLVPDFMWIQWYGDLEHAELWSQALTELEYSARLEFFAKLASDGKLTADEFCVFLLEKNEAVFKYLWSRVPEPQWSTWIKESNLPPTTLSFLNTMPYPLSVQFFKEMLTAKPEDMLSFCVTPDKTIEQFYPDEVTAAMLNATAVSDAKAKLGALKKKKSDDFDASILKLIEDMNALNTKLETMPPIDTSKPQGWSVYLPAFFKAQPCAAQVHSINGSKDALNKSCTQTASHPLLTVVESEPKVIDNFIKLNQTLRRVREQIKLLCEKFEELPSNLSQASADLELVFKKIETMNAVTLAMKAECELTPAAINEEVLVRRRAPN